MSQTYIIAEAGVNHNGSLNMAMDLVNAAVAAGADAVKFQTFKAEKLISKHARKAEYQTKTTDSNERQLDMVKRLELDRNAHAALIDYCAQQKIQFLSTPFEEESADYLIRVLKLPLIKIPSGEITNPLLLLQVASTSTPVIMSTGMSTLAEIETALGVLAFGYLGLQDAYSREAFQKAYASEAGREALVDKVVLLHCTTEYPAAFSEVNLRAMDTMAAAFGLPVGLSDHTPGMAAPIAAVARGAVVIEKHFTLDKELPGPDHKASLSPDELKEMVYSIRQVEAALGQGRKVPAASELKNRELIRKSIVAARDIKAGEVFSPDNITVKRPGTGLAPMNFWDVCGKAASRDFEQDEEIEL